MTEKKSFIGVIASALLAVAFTAAALPANAVAAEPSGTEQGRIYVVGQEFIEGDFGVIESDGHYVLVDAGPAENAESNAAFLADSGITYLDYIIISDPTPDNTGGLGTILDSFGVGRIYMKPAASEDSEVNQSVIPMINGKGIELVTSVEEGYTEVLGNLTIKFVNCSEPAEGEGVNSYGLIITDTLGDTVFLGGDITNNDGDETALAAMYPELKDVDVIKAPHHAKVDACDHDFMSYLNPGAAVITGSYIEDPFAYRFTPVETNKRTFYTYMITSVIVLDSPMYILREGESKLVYPEGFVREDDNGQETADDVQQAEQAGTDTEAPEVETEPETDGYTMTESDERDAVIDSEEELAMQMYLERIGGQDNGADENTLPDENLQTPEAVAETMTGESGVPSSTDGDETAVTDDASEGETSEAVTEEIQEAEEETTTAEETTEYDPDLTYYRFTFDTDGRGETPAEQSVAEGRCAVTPDEICSEGLTFAGWYANKSRTEMYDFSLPVYADTTVYAKWNTNLYDIQFDANGGTGVMTDQHCTYGRSETLKANAFTNGTKIFDGWCTSADGNGAWYSDKSVVNSLASENGAAVTLYAMWRDVTKVTSGSGQTVYPQSGGMPVFTVNATADSLQSVTVDGREIDPSYYSVTGENELSVKISDVALKTLSAGEHSVSIRLKDGTGCSTSFYVAGSSLSQGGGGSSLSVIMIVVIAVLGVAAVVLILVKIKKK